ncbi:MAG TPA: CopG family transcriptional regulator [Candidatus Sulfomarinibacteraceae bacterium]|nr:CopG family transcriptional regulator [Candidatus Sulfomarinibacteraceae bacterium]
MEKTTLYLTEELQAELRALARSRGRPQAELIRDALAEYVARAERPWPRSIGIVSSGAVPAREAKARVRELWDERHPPRRPAPEQ